MAFTLRQLKYALAVAREGSITEASKQVGISQPAVSTALKELEIEFGYSIFLRQPAHKIALTPAGHRFMRHAQRMMENIAEFEANAKGIGHRLGGSIEVGCFLPTAPFIMPMILHAMEDKYPGIDVHFHEYNLGELNDGIKSGSIEVALMYDMHPDRKITFEPLIEAKPYVLLSANDPLAKKKHIKLDDLKGKKMAQFDLPITQDYFQNIASMIKDPPKFVYRTKSYEMLRSLVSSEQGFAILIMNPQSDRAYDGSKLVGKPIADPIPPTRYGLAMAKDYAPRQSILAFMEVCRETLKDNAAADGYFLS